VSWPLSRWSSVEASPGAGWRHLGIRNARDGLYFARVLGFATMAPALMRLGPARLDRLLEAGISGRPVLASDANHVAACVDGAMRLGYPAVRPGCLTRGLTMYYFLRRAGLPVRLHFGMGVVAGSLVGHCWIVHHGGPFLEHTDPSPIFRSVCAFPGTAPAS